jgi:hypothetical protein
LIGTLKGGWIDRRMGKYVKHIIRG